MLSIVCVVVHPSRLAREGLSAILANSPFDPVCTTSSIEEVPSTIGGAGEQVLLLVGIREVAYVAKALSAAKASFPDALVVVSGDSSNRDLLITALASGATTFIDENAATSTLIMTLELVAQGEPVISVLLMKRMFGSISHSSIEAVPTSPAHHSQAPDEEHAQSNPQLSAKEAKILNALAQGTPNKVIAYRFCITEATVKVHVKAILRKIGVANRTQAAMWALQQLPPSS
jgi:two-component system nitrate/nitrite response regulator NarL